MTRGNGNDPAVQPFRRLVVPGAPTRRMRIWVALLGAWRGVIAAAKNGWVQAVVGGLLVLVIAGYIGLG